MASRSPCTLTMAFACLAACGGTPRTPVRAETAPEPPKPRVAPAPERHELANLESPPPPKLLSIDWAHTKLDTEADALAVWSQIAPTGSDWEAKLDEVPDTAARPLALALLHQGNFTCVTPTPVTDCVKPKLDVDEPAETASFSDPCLRRLLAVWALQQIDGNDPAMLDLLRPLVAIPPPESLLVGAALSTQDGQDARLELLGIAWRAGHRDLVNNALGDLDDAHLRTAATQLHIDGAYEALDAHDQRALFLSAISDEQISPTTRRQAMLELADAADADNQPLPADLRTALAAATHAKDCSVAAQAIRIFHDHKDDRFVPKRSAKTAMRTMCVIASLELLQRNDEASLVTLLVPPRGLELVKVEYDPYSDADPDGDGDPHTTRTITLIPRTELALPDVDDLVRAFEHCTGTTCRSEQHEFHFVWKGPFLDRLEEIERPPCPSTPGISTP